MNEKADRIQESVTRLQERLCDIAHMVAMEKAQYSQLKDNRMQEALPSKKEKESLMRQN